MRVKVISMTETEIVLESKEEFMFMWYRLCYSGDEWDRFQTEYKVNKQAIKLFTGNMWSKLNRILGFTKEERQEECQKNKEA